MAFFNGFRVLKYVHDTRDHFYGNVTIEEALLWLESSYLNAHLNQDKYEALRQLRDLDHQMKNLVRNSTKKGFLLLNPIPLT